MYDFPCVNQLVHKTEYGIEGIKNENVDIKCYIFERVCV